MRMAKPSEHELEAAWELRYILELIDERFGGPWGIEGPESLQQLLKPQKASESWTDFDADDEKHLQALYNSLAKLLRVYPGFYGRVLVGMAVLCDPHNAILDQSQDHLALHPDLIAGQKLLAAKRPYFLPSMEQAARNAVAQTIEAAAARHLREMQEESELRQFLDSMLMPEPTAEGLLSDAEIIEAQEWARAQ